MNAAQPLLRKVFFENVHTLWDKNKLISASTLKSLNISRYYFKRNTSLYQVIVHYLGHNSSFWPWSNFGNQITFHSVLWENERPGKRLANCCLVWHECCWGKKIVNFFFLKTYSFKTKKYFYPVLKFWSIFKCSKFMPNSKSKQGQILNGACTKVYCWINLLS